MEELFLYKITGIIDELIGQDIDIDKLDAADNALIKSRQHIEDIRKDYWQKLDEQRQERKKGLNCLGSLSVRTRCSKCSGSEANMYSRSTDKFESEYCIICESCGNATEFYPTSAQASFAWYDMWKNRQEK